jgi:DNA-3-methyladenine glycosylase II
MTRMFLPVPAEFNYRLNLEFLKRSPKELLHQLEGDDVLKVVKHNHEKTLIRIRPGNKKLIIDFLNEEPSRDTKQHVKKYITEWFDLENDLKPFYKSVKNDSLLGPLVKKFFGYRIIGQPDLFESIIWAVIGQQINLQFAYTLKSRFVEHFGERLFWNNESFYLFPNPQLVGGLDPQILLKHQFSTQKAKYIVGIAEEFASGNITKEKIGELNFTEAKERLMAVKGIGNWTANYALMKTFRYKEAFPLEDAGIHNAIKNLKGMTRKPTLDEVKRIFRNYKGWEAYATLYLWKSL